MRLTYKAQDQHGEETGTVWYAITAGNNIFPKSDKEEQALKKLAAYEDAEEQGRLVRLPCAVGDMVYYRRGRYVIGDTVMKIIIDEFGNRAVLDCHNKEFYFEDFGKAAFLTREEAEAALNGGQDDGGA